MATMLMGALDSAADTRTHAHRAIRKRSTAPRRYRRTTRILLAKGKAVAATVLLVLVLGGLLVAEYGLLWHVVLQPWLNAFARPGW
jgi:hypothetical protein